MSHAYHPSLPNYVEHAVFHTGCTECEHRAARGVAALTSLDEDNKRILFLRAYHWRRDRTFPIDPLESPLFHDLEVLAVTFHRYPMLLGLLVPPQRETPHDLWIRGAGPRP